MGFNEKNLVEFKEGGLVGPFFFAEDVTLVHFIRIEEATEYGDFLISEESHNEIWNNHYAQRYNVDFDYYPRGRIVYRKTDDTFVIYTDKCILIEDKRRFDLMLDMFLGDVKYEIASDEHYVCHKCNENYCI